MLAKYLRPKRPIRVNPNYIVSLRMFIHLLCWSLIAHRFYNAISGQLLGDPVQYLIDFTGISAINLLLLSLCVSPLSQTFKFSQLIPVRRTLGVYSAVYALFHLSVFIAFELQFEWRLIASEIVDRPYITVGFAALLILASLLITSLNRIRRAMGRSWFSLHNFTYLALILATTHYVWSIKSDELQPLVYIGLAIFVLILRKKKIYSIFK